MKYVRPLRRKASSSRAQGADGEGNRYFVQVIVEGMPYQKPKNQPSHDTIGLDIGPSSLAVVSREGEAQLVEFCEQLRPDMRQKRRLQRQMQRQRRANNPHNYDERGRVKKHGKRRLYWHDSRGYQATRRRHATQERKLAAHRKSLHGKLVNDLVRVGHHIQIEKTSFKGWQKRYGKSLGLRGPEASASPEPERVGPKVGSRTDKSSPPSLAEAGEKRWGWHKNPRFFRAGRFSCLRVKGGLLYVFFDTLVFPDNLWEVSFLFTCHV